MRDHVVADMKEITNEGGEEEDWSNLNMAEVDNDDATSIAELEISVGATRMS